MTLVVMRCKAAMHGCDMERRASLRYSAALAAHRCVCSWTSKPASTSPVQPTRSADSKKIGEIE